MATSPVSHPAPMDPASPGSQTVVYPGGLTHDHLQKMPSSLIDMCNGLCSQNIASEYNMSKRQALNKTQHKPLRIASVNSNVPTQQPVFALAPSAPDVENDARLTRPASPKKDDSADVRMASPSPDRSGRISPSRRSPSRIVSALPGASLLDPAETPLASTKPFPSPHVARSASLSALGQAQARSPRMAHSHSQPTLHPGVKTSMSHPMHISALLPIELLPRISASVFSVSNAAALPKAWHVAQAPDTKTTTTQVIGNLFLSSCPGKKVRLNGPIVPGGRSAICRDLRIDLQRALRAPYRVKVVVCCLDDTELAFLGVPWTEYEQTARELGLRVVRIPLVEGFAPESVEEVDAIVGQIITEHTLQGDSVLVHCRGGVGRAGSIAVCWYAKLGLAGNFATETLDTLVRNAVRWVRERRSTKAIETPLQVLFVHNYIQHLQTQCKPASASQLLALAAR